MWHLKQLFPNKARYANRATIVHKEESKFALGRSLCLLVYSLLPNCFPLVLMSAWNFSNGLYFLKELISQQIILIQVNHFRKDTKVHSTWVILICKIFQVLSRVTLAALASSVVCKSGWLPESFFQNQMAYFITECTMPLRNWLSQMKKCHLFYLSTFCPYFSMVLKVSEYFPTCTLQAQQGCFQPIILNWYFISLNADRNILRIFDTFSFPPRYLNNKSSNIFCFLLLPLCSNSIWNSLSHEQSFNLFEYVELVHIMCSVGLQRTHFTPFLGSLLWPETHPYSQGMI